MFEHKISLNNMKEISEYNWLKYEKLNDAHSYLVLRLFRDEYVIHIYNSQDDRHYYGIYCGDDLTQAQQVYQCKLAHYLIKKITPRPYDLIDILNQIRLSGMCNIADVVMVIQTLENYNRKDVAEYISENRDKYVNILRQLEEYIRENEPKSLAQQLADEMGWEVIID